MSEAKHLVAVGDSGSLEKLTDEEKVLITQGLRGHALGDFLDRLLDLEPLVPQGDYTACPKDMILKDDVSLGVQFTPEKLCLHETALRSDGRRPTGHEEYLLFNKDEKYKDFELLGINHAHFLIENYWRISPELVGKSVVFMGTRFHKQGLVSEKNDYLFVIVLDIRSDGPPDYHMKCLIDTLCHHYLIATS